MKIYNDKDRIGFWVRLYNRLQGETYTVESWPDDDSSKKNIDAICRNAVGHTLALEHTLIEPFAGDKADADPSFKTLGVLENHPLLTLPGNMIMVSQAVGAIPRGVKSTKSPQPSSGSWLLCFRPFPKGGTRSRLRGQVDAGSKCQQDQNRPGSSTGRFSAWLSRRSWTRADRRGARKESRSWQDWAGVRFCCLKGCRCGHNRSAVRATA